MTLDLELQPIDWETLKKAIYDWVVDTLGIDVIWSNFNLPQPPYPYVSLNIISGPIKEGGNDELRFETDLNRPAGEEIKITNTDQVTFTVSIQCHIDNDTYIDNPNCDAIALATKLQSSLGKRSVIDAFNQAKLCSMRWDGPLDISEEFNGKWTRRSSLDITFRTVTEVTEKTGYIDKVNLISDNLNVNTIIQET